VLGHSGRHRRRLLKDRLFSRTIYLQAICDSAPDLFRIYPRTIWTHPLLSRSHHIHRPPGRREPLAIYELRHPGLLGPFNPADPFGPRLRSEAQSLTQIVCSSPPRIFPEVRPLFPFSFSSII
jgi:hypothetical protein